MAIVLCWQVDTIVCHNNIVVKEMPILGLNIILGPDECCLRTAVSTIMNQEVINMPKINMEASG